VAGRRLVEGLVVGVEHHVCVLNRAHGRSRRRRVAEWVADILDAHAAQPTLSAPSPRPTPSVARHLESRLVVWTRESERTSSLVPAVNLDERSSIRDCPGTVESRTALDLGAQPQRNPRARSSALHRGNQEESVRSFEASARIRYDVGARFRCAAATTGRANAGLVALAQR
jgi:hypothetical protein